MSAPVTVTRADREAGAAFWAFLGQHGSAEHCRNGTGFRDTAEHFARHRTTSQAELVEALRELLPFVATQSIGCHGYKCREAWCWSCNEDEDAEASAEKGSAAEAAARTLLAKIEGDA